MYLLRPIGYLEKSDFSENGELLGPLNNIPVFIMIQGSYCGACTNAKPAFQQLANEGMIQCMTIQLDGDRQTEKDIKSIIHRIYPDLEGIPGYILYLGNNRRVPYIGTRSTEDMRNFIRQQLSQ
jgi:thiol-disulfide isomerase/thioredoxin